MSNEFIGYRIEVIRRHLDSANTKRAESKTSEINQQLTAMIERILDYIEHGTGDFDER